MRESRSGVRAPARHRRTGHPVLISVLVLAVLIGGAAATAMALGPRPVDEPSATMPTQGDASLVATPSAVAVQTPAATPVDAEPDASDGTEAALLTSSPVMVTEIRPSIGSALGGEAVVISGSGFAAPMSVRIAGRDAPDVEVLNPQTARVITPSGRSGPAVIEVWVDGTAAVPADDLFAYADQPARVVMAVRPDRGSLAGGTLVTIVGTGFEDGARVVLGRERARDVTVVDATRITAVTPPGMEGPVDVIVRNPDLPAAVLREAFAYVPGPAITAVEPAELRMDGGSVMTISGSGFLPGAQVIVNGMPATDVEVLDEFMIRAAAPAGALGPATVVVVNADQPEAVRPSAVTYVIPPPEPGGDDPVDDGVEPIEPTAAAPEEGSSAG